MKDKIIQIPDKTDLIKPAVPLMTRDEALGLLQEVIAISKYKAVTGRVKNAENEKIRQTWARVAIHGISAYFTGLRDSQLDDIDTRLKAIEETTP